MTAVALTGATGFLGDATARALLKRGAAVKALARPGRPPPDGTTPVEGDLEDWRALERLCDRADVVVHVAGAVRARSAAEFERVNAEGAAAVAVAAGSSRFLLISSLAAREPQLSPYAASKRLGEVMVERVVPPDRLTIVRPTAIYGPGDLEWLRMFRRAAEGRTLPDFSRPESRVSLIHVDDAGEAIAALTLEAARPGTWALCDERPEGYGWPELYAAAALATHGPPPKVRQASPALLHAAGAMGEATAWLMRRPAFLSRGKAREALHPDWSVTPSERPRLPSARFDLNRGFADTAAWYRSHGFLRA